MADQLTTWLRQAGFKGPSLRTMWAIVQRESGGRPDAFNGNAGTGDRSYGLAQINMLGALGPSRMKQFGLKSENDLLDPITNLKVAYRMSKGGKDFGAWGVGPRAYRKTAPLDYSGFPGQPQRQMAATAPAVAAPGPSQPAAQPQVTIPQLNQLARQFGFKSFAQAFGFDDGQIAQLIKPILPAVAQIGEQQIPVVNGTGRNLPRGTEKTLGKVVGLAHEYLGTPYVWGGKQPGGFDCSGLIQYIYGKVGVKLPGYTIPLFATGKKVAKGALRPGDAVFFNMGKHPETGENGPLHMGIAIGGGLFIQAPRSGDVVKISRLDDRDDFVGARRYV